jgi:galactonate dehydratase
VRVTSVDKLFVDRYLFVRVNTDEGISGLGESGAWAYLEASAAAVDRFAEYLVGQDPSAVEHHWQYMYRWTHFRGAAIMGALSALDIALWDIAGKVHGVPVHRLFGGPVRHKARVYRHVSGDSTEKLVAGCREAAAAGFTAIGHLTPFLDEPRFQPFFATYAGQLGDAIDRVGEYREAVGKEVDLCVELHRRLTPAEAVVFGHGVEQYLPMFVEDPIRPDNFDAMESVARQIRVPIATGERLHTAEEFAMLLRRDAVQYVRPDVCLAGGLSQARKIAAVAEAFNVEVVPHNPLSPVSTAACLQLAASIPNFALLEYPLGGLMGVHEELVRQAPELKDGFLIVPNGPGIGVELAEDVERLYPARPRKLMTRLSVDGSVVDQ